MYIKLYKQDGSPVSEAPITANAIRFVFSAGLDEESQPVWLRAKADAGYLINEVVVTPTGTSANKWALAPDNAGVPGVWKNWGEALDLGNNCDSVTGIKFWVKAKSSVDEPPKNDTGVTLEVVGVTLAA